MSRIQELLWEAALVSRLKADDRRFYVGAIGIRKDGTKVRAYNGNPKEPDRYHHAEYRLSRKLDRGSTVYVARALRGAGIRPAFRGTGHSQVGGYSLIGTAKPCHNCEKVLRYSGVTRVYYSITDTEWGCILL
jgi:tRNA(Arg) A34 adenosine deaminase TadA